LVVTYSEANSVSFNDVRVHNVRKLDFHANLCEAFAEDKKQYDCGDLVLEWAVSQKAVIKY